MEHSPELKIEPEKKFIEGEKEKLQDLLRDGKDTFKEKIKNMDTAKLNNISKKMKFLLAGFAGFSGVLLLLTAYTLVIKELEMREKKSF